MELMKGTSKVTSTNIGARAAKRGGVLTDGELVRIWAEVLQLEHVDMDANVFELGADSHAVVQVCMRLHAMLDREIRVVTLFQFPTIRALAEHLRQQGDESTSP